MGEHWGIAEISLSNASTSMQLGPKLYMPSHAYRVLRAHDGSVRAGGKGVKVEAVDEEKAAEIQARQESARKWVAEWRESLKVKA